jgi:hypothetical protein
MKVLWGSLLLIMFLAALVPGHMRAQAPTEWHDALVDHMIGTWKLRGQVMMEQKDKDGKWTNFADLTLARSPHSR